MGDRRDPDRGSAADRLTPGGVAIAAAAIVVVMIGIALAAWHGGEGSATTSTVTETRTGKPAGVAVSPGVAAGAHDFTRFACDQCHGDRGAGGVSPDVPALTSVAQTLSVAQLTKIINHGLGESSNPTKPYMPVWHGIISGRQIRDIVAYLHAGLPPVRDAQPLEVPPDQGAVVAGSVLYTNLGCINCHGPNGLGGVPNPRSEDRTIPPLSGADFRAEFDTPAKIRDVIVSGSVLGRAPIVSMPHWGGILSPAEVAELIAYIRTLG